MRGLTAEGLVVECKRVPFAGLHLGDLLLHFQGIMLLLKMFVVMKACLSLEEVSVCKRKLLSYPRQLGVDPKLGRHDVLRR
jgi:hypothetical protein